MDLWVDEFNRLHPTKKSSIRDVTSWAFFEKDPFNISTEHAFEIFDYCWRHWEYIKPVEVDQDVKIEMLRELGTVDIVTSVVKNKDPIKKWLAAHNIKPDNIVFTQEKWKLDYDVFIDDSPHNAEEILKENHMNNKNKICLLYNELWNRSVKTDNDKIIRVYSLNHAYDIIKEMSNEK